MKTAQLSSQFNWIYVLLVGGFILTLFITLSSGQKEVSEKKIDALSMEGITTIFEAARTGNSLSTKIDLSEITMTFTCEEFDKESPSNYLYSDYSVNSLHRRIPGVVVFAPSTLRGRDLTTWTFAWEMPYKIMNFFYIVNSKTRIYFDLSDENQNLRTAIKESLSSDIIHEFVSSTDELLDANDDLTIIVIDEQTQPSELYDHIKEFNKDVVIVQIKPYGVDVPPRNPTAYFGDIAFYDKDGIKQETETKYFGLASLYGAILSGNKEYYECTMKKAVERMKRVSCILNQKYHTLEQSNIGPTCKSVMLSAQHIQQSFFSSENAEPFCSYNNQLILELGATDFDIFEKGIDSESGKYLAYEYYIGMRNQNRKSIGESCESLY